MLLFDGDIGLANVDVQLGLTPPRDLSKVFHLRRAAHRTSITSFAPNFDIIAGRSGTGSLATLAGGALTSLKEQLNDLSSSYDVIFIDLGAGVEEHVRALAAAAARCIVVVTDEPTSLTDAYAFIKLLTNGGGQRMDIGVVVNQSATLKEGQKTYTSLSRACANFLKFSPECLGIIRKDGKVKDAIRHQSSLITRAPHCTAASDAATITIKLMRK